MLDPSTQTIYRQLAVWMARRVGAQRCPIFGISGAQGCGKSTAAGFLGKELRAVHGLEAVVVSLDDFYLQRAARQELATRVHPLFSTRGVPGTHDVALGFHILTRLRDLRSGETLALPQFSKAADDRVATTQWPIIDGPVDLVLFEGWCVGVPPQPTSDLAAPANDLEAEEDAEGSWRYSVNEQLGTSYADWFSRLDAQIFLRVPDFECVRRWRWQQEQDTARGAGAEATGLQSQTQLDRFIKHYERLTTHALRVMPDRVDAVLTLLEDHAVAQIQFRPGQADA